MARRRMVLPFDVQCRASGLPPPVAEHRFHPVRRWRIDWAWPDHKLALEIEGSNADGRLVFHWNRRMVKKGAEPFKLLSKRRSQRRES